MKSDRQIADPKASPNPGLRIAFRLRKIVTLLLLTGSITAFSASNAPAPAPETPREFFNEGTGKLREGRLREAESFLQSAVSSQDTTLQPLALYNLGHVRFSQGSELLEKAPDGNRTTARGLAATQNGMAAIRAADEAIASKDVQRLVTAYKLGRGARKELKAATKAVLQAMEAYAEVLLKWERAGGDFKSAAELNPAGTNATHNGQVVDRHIAMLVDRIRELMNQRGMMNKVRQELEEKLKEMGGMIPDSEMPPGAPGEEEEEEDMPFGPQPGMKEGETKGGEEMQLTPEEAGDMLKGFRLDGERRLPMGGNEKNPPKDPNGPDW